MIGLQMLMTKDSEFIDGTVQYAARGNFVKFAKIPLPAT